MRVITYGTFDLFHEGHRRLLERARELGDHLIVGVTTEGYDDSRGKLNVTQSLMERVRNVQDSGLADEVIIEEFEGQKVRDIQKYEVDVFAIGSDWLGKFDYLEPYCQVVYLERTKGISSTQLRNEQGLLRLGVVGAGRIASRFVAEARFVSGVSVEAVHSRSLTSAREFADRFELRAAHASYQDLLADVDAVYIASPHEFHVEHVKGAIEAGRHVLCEKPLALSAAEATELFALARQHQVVLLEAVKTAFAPGFQRLIAVAGSGYIGQIRAVQATFTKLVGEGRELQPPHGGSLTELATYPLLAIVKLLGTDPVGVESLVWESAEEVDLYARTTVLYREAVGTAVTGLAVKSDGSLVVAGTLGYVHVPAPWWLTEFFEVCFEDPRQNKKYFYKFDGDGLRYELAEFVTMVRSGAWESYKLRQEESVAIARLLEQARSGAVSFGS